VVGEEGTSRNQVAGDIPSNPLDASVHHTHDEAVAIDRSQVEDTNALEGRMPEAVAVAHRSQC